MRTLSIVRQWVAVLCTSALAGEGVATICIWVSAPEGVAASAGIAAFLFTVWDMSARWEPRPAALIAVGIGRLEAGGAEPLPGAK